MAVLGTSAALACVSVSANDSAPGGSGGATGGRVEAATGGRSAGSGGAPAPDGGILVAEDAGACTRLNIGILGNPGANGSSNFQMWLQARGTSVQRLQTTADVPLTADTLRAFDVILLDWLPRNYAAEEAAIFAAWVSAGGGVIALSGYHDNSDEDWRANSLLAPLGLGFTGPLRWGPVTDFAVHPITASLTSVTFTGGYAVSVPADASATATPLAFVSANGDRAAVALAAEAGKGKAFLWADEWIEFDSEWSSLPQIPRLWLQIFSWIGPQDRCMLTGIG